MLKPDLVPSADPFKSLWCRDGVVCSRAFVSTFINTSLCSAINSVETSDRNFTAFQNVAMALNGTSTSTGTGTGTSTDTTSNTPSATSPSHSGASSTRHGYLRLIIISAALVVAFA